MVQDLLVWIVSDIFPKSSTWMKDELIQLSEAKIPNILKVVYLLYV